jgi:cytoplasmic iron level regulating protein YaaA (DUF328/UPF0246 family)
MLLLISPAKTLDYDSELPRVRSSQPRLLDDSEVLIDDLKQLSPAKVSSLMSISDKLGKLNADRFNSWKRPFSNDNARPALFAFKGDVYTGLDAYNLDSSTLAEAQKQLRILSGLYGLLRPMDLMQPYRLEMGTKFNNPRGKDLYAFWKDTLTPVLKKDLKASGSDIIVNLASNEYYKAVDSKALDARIVTPVFQDEKNGKYKIISFYAKKARGLMAAWILQNRVYDVEGLSGFNVSGYRFSAKDSQGDTLVFRRTEKAAQAV